jgi:anti-sigma-K factor RskA
MSREDLDRRAAEHVLGLLDAHESREAERLAATDEEFRAAVEAWRQRLAELDVAAPSMPAGEALWQRIADGLEAQASASPAPAVRTSRTFASSWRALWDSLAFWRVAGLVGAAASVLLAVGLAIIAEQRSRQPVLVAVLLTEANRAAAVVNTFADGRAELIPLESIAVPPGRALQIWTLWDRARGPVSVGLIDEARTVRLQLENLPRTVPNQLFEITLEPSAGSPTGRPTGPVLMKGTTSTAL